jgi:predicted secreted hydrolase
MPFSALSVVKSSLPSNLADCTCRVPSARELDKSSYGSENSTTVRKKAIKTKIRFPRDEGAHPAFPAEWCYVHLSLADNEGREYGAMVAYFTFGLKILSITDLAAGRFHNFVSGSALHYVEGKFDLRWGRDHWFRTDQHSFSYKLESYGAGLGLDIALVSEKPPLPGSGRGVSKWTGGDSYYYSFTSLKAKGQIELQGQKLDVGGIGWMDHQWINSLGQGGWDWFAVQFDNNTELIFWRIVNPDESVKSYDLTIMMPDNSVHHTHEIVLERLDSWVSPQSGREYGVAWRVREKARGLDLVLRARHAQQEIRMFESLSVPTFNFWEGRTTVSGYLEGQAVSGIGYSEQVRLPHTTG